MWLSRCNSEKGHSHLYFGFPDLCVLGEMAQYFFHTSWKHLLQPWDNCRDLCHHQRFERCSNGDSYHTLIELFFWLVRKLMACREWPDHCKLNYTGMQIASAISDMVYLLTECNTTASGRYTHLLIQKMFYFHTSYSSSSGRDSGVLVTALL